jgi:hypothetical protein
MRQGEKTGAPGNAFSVRRGDAARCFAHWLGKPASGPPRAGAYRTGKVQGAGRQGGSSPGIAGGADLGVDQAQQVQALGEGGGGPGGVVVAGVVDCEGGNDWEADPIGTPTRVCERTSSGYSYLPSHVGSAPAPASGARCIPVLQASTIQAQTLGQGEPARIAGEGYGKGTFR